jgi:chromosome segregation ATPase
MQLNPTPEPAPGFSPDLPPSQYGPAIKNLQAVAENNDDPSASQDAHLHLSWLYSSYKNPTRDYHKALEQIEQYLAAATETKDLYDAKNLQSLLMEISAADSRFAATEQQHTADLKQLHAETNGLRAQVVELQNKAGRLLSANQTLMEQNTVLGNNNRELASYNKSLLEKNKEFEETIDRLKNLEMQLEQKRKTFK